MNNVVIYCGSNAGGLIGYTQAAAAIGTILQALDLSLIYGGTNQGLMNLIVDSCLDNGVQIHGVITKKLVSLGKLHQELKSFDVVESVLERKKLMLSKADYAIALSGGIGTVEEIFTTLSHNQFEEKKIPVGILNIEGYYNGIGDMFKTMLKNGFINKGYDNDLIISSNIDSIFSFFTSWQNTPTPSKWL